MKITLNGLEYPENIITFTNCPTILTMEDTWTGTKSRGTITVSTLSGNFDLDDSTISVDGYTIKSTSDMTKVVGSTFYLTHSNTSSSKLYVAYTIVNALRNVPSLSSKYNIYLDTRTAAFNPTVIIDCIENGNFPINISIPQNLRFELTTSSTVGSIASVFNGNYHNKILLDIYQVNNPNRLNGTASTALTFITTLEKNVFNSNVSFDLSPIFNTYTEFNDMSQFMINVYRQVDGSITEIRTLTNIFATTGYLVNQGGSFMPRFTGCVLAQNVSRGAISSTLNKSLLYVYEPNIVFSMFADASVSSMSVNVNYLDGSLERINGSTQTIFAGNNLNTFTINLNEEYFNQSSYVDIVIPNLGTLRYNVIKPIHATEDCQRIYWTNSYGGTSFFDFTGNRTEERKTDIETYDKSLYDYYTTSRAELTQVYSKEVEITVTLSTHNIAKDGTWQLFDLQNSYNAWTVVNGKQYSVHITDIKIDETDVAGIYTGEIEYTYSMGDTF